MPTAPFAQLYKASPFSLRVEQLPSWNVVSTDDFNGDNKTDILWQNNDGKISVWLMDGASYINGDTIFVPPAGQSYEIAGVGDLNGDRKADILLSQKIMGENGEQVISIDLLEMDGTCSTQSGDGRAL
jgi:FG-GAP-like repeat